MQNASSILECANIVMRSSREYATVVTVSAVGGITNQLIEIIIFAKNQKPRIVKARLQEMEDRHKDILTSILVDSEDAETIWRNEFQPRFGKLRAILYGTSLVGDITPKTEANICSYGEKFAALLMRFALQSIDVKCRIVKAERIIRTDSSYLEAKIFQKNTFEACQKFVNPLLSRNRVPIIPGFTGKDTHGDVTLLGRGGGDYTAAILAMALGASRIEIWTDVNGVMTCDPRIVHDAFSWSALDMDVMSELAYSGVKIVHPKSIELAIERDIPVVIYNTFDRSFKGTLVNRQRTSGIKGIVSSSDNVLLNLKKPNMLEGVGFIAKISDIVKNHDVSIDVCTTSETSFSFSIKGKDFSKKLLKDLEEFASVSVTNSVAKICIIGNNITKDSKKMFEIFTICADNNIRIYSISVSASFNNITFLINDKDKIETMQVLHRNLIKKLRSQ